MPQYSFAHIADCHLGSWRDEKMREIGLASFTQAIAMCIQKKVDFVIIAGDLFNTALPSIETLKHTVRQLQKLKEKHIPVYLIAGSHDYSPAGKTMLHIIEEAQLAKNLLQADMTDEKLTLKITTDPKTKIKLCGILGRAVSLEKTYYDMLDRQALESEDGFKIFVFHSAISELKPDTIDDSFATKLSLLPKGFNYYAGGHVHYRFNKTIQGYGQIVYPGPIFPNSFSEIEDLHHGSFVINTVDTDSAQIKSTQENIILHQHKAITVDVTGRTISEIEQQILTAHDDVKDAIITIRLKGTLGRQAISEINFETIYAQLYERGAYFIMKNTAQATEDTPEQTMIKNTEYEEETIIKQQFTQYFDTEKNPEHTPAFVQQIMHQLDTFKQDGETKTDYEKRVIENSKELLDKLL